MNTQEDPALDQDTEGEQSKHGWSILIDDKVYRSDDPDIIRLDDPDADDKLQKIISNTEAFKKLKDVSERLKRLNEIKMKMNPNESPTIERLADTVQRITDRIEDLDPETLQAEPDILEAIAREECKKANSYIPQGNVTNAFAKIRPIEGKNMSIDPATGIATIESHCVNMDMELTILDYDIRKGLKTSTQQLLDALEKLAGRSNSNTVILDVNEYIKQRGLKDRKDAKKQIVEDMEVLLKTSVKWTEKHGDKVEPHGGMNLSQIWIWANRKKTAIVYTFGEIFFNMLKKLPPMYYPPELQRINGGKNPNSYPLLRKISEHKRMNLGKPNENIISVKTLLEVCENVIPTYESVMNGNRNTTKRIIEPFERDMNEVEEAITWEYCHTNGTPLTDQELQNFNYDIFIKCLVLINWRYYPDKTKLIEARKAHAEKAKEEKTRDKKRGKKGERGGYPCAERGLPLCRKGVTPVHKGG